MFSHPLKNLAVAMSLALAAHAMAAPVSLDLPSQPLATSLRQLGETAGLTIAVDDGIVAQRNAPAIKGNLEPLDALRRLLDGSGLTYQKQGSTLIVSPRNDSAIELGATSIQGQGMGEATENSGSYTTGLTSVGSKTPTSLRQTPQSISIVSQQLMADQQMADINDAMRATPGLSVQNDTYRTSYILSRGFKLENFQLDGAAPMAQGSAVGSFYSSNILDLAEFDHIEVLRGSAALFGGTGDPGGIVNMVRKRPLDTFQLKLTASAGSWDNYRQELDVTGPIAFDGKLRGRMVVANTDRQYFIDNRSTEKPLVYGVMEADVTDDTMLTAGFRYNKSHENGTQTSVPRYLDGSDIGLSRSASLGTKWGYTDVTGREVFAKIDHKLSDDWKVNVSYTDLWDVGYFKTSTVLGVGVNPATGAGLSWNSSTSKQENQQRMWDANLAGKFELFGLEHDIVVGGDYQEINSRWLGATRVPGGALNPFDPDSTPFPEPADNTNYSRDYSPNDQTQYGLYGSLRLQLAEPLHLILGARVQRFKFDQLYQTRSGNTWTTQSDISMREPTKVTPYGGLVYDLNDEWSVYGSYSEIYKPQASLRDGQGNALEAMQGKTYETGLKGELFGGSVNTNVALYYTTRENQGVRDPGYPQNDFDFAGSCCYVSNGEVVSKGIDMEVSGEVMPDWMLMAGYTFNMNRNKDADAPLSTMTPKHLFKMFSTYRLPGVFSDFKVGGGVNLQSSNYFSGTVTSNGASNAYDFSQSGYAVWNALAEYRVDEHWTVTYNANNIFDKNYYATVGSTSATNWYGEPRNHMLTLRGTFW
ncbi:TonB-dependent siderophore receptor [Pseudomonas syringae group sp. J309-1]|nr:TonB-dependent siderophore receptor [Pseudomonas syringae group sp. J309-1]MDU8357188.1 TonB-dependent siderophore receptor [Pseudomonas syringae group sp. J309-1]